MRLAQFIRENMEAILAAWEAFALTTTQGAYMGRLALRDHAEEILRASAREMEFPRDAAQEQPAGHETVLQVASAAHALDRVESGFNLFEVVSEYRALRSSVVQLWRDTAGRHHDPADVDDLSRFDDCIDQSLATAISSYTQRIDRSRQMFLAILGHDLRNPLNSVLMSAQALEGSNLDEEARQTASQISSSAGAMSRMIRDLLDFTGAGLGGGMPLSPGPADLEAICRDVCGEMRAAYPGRPIGFDTSGGATGTWDAARLRQVVSNLMGNALQHGGGGPVNLRVAATGGEVLLSVRNQGEPIPPEALPTIFDPLTRVSREVTRQRRPGSIGLGLYIAREIVIAHKGVIGVQSSAAVGTIFTLRLPRHVLAAPEPGPEPASVRKRTAAATTQAASLVL